MAKDLPDFLSEIVSAAVEASSFRGGPFSARPAAPAAKDIYFATDTKVLYICVTDGAWTGFDAAILVQGVLTLYANLAGNAKRITNIADPTAAQDAATRAYVLAQLAGYLSVAHETATTGIHGVGASTIDSVAGRDAAIAVEAATRAAADALRLLLTGGTMSGPIAMGANKITGLANPTVAQDAATRAWVLLQVAGFLLLTGGTMSGAIAMGGNKVTGLGAPTAAADSARKTEVDTVDAKLDDVSHDEPARDFAETYRNNSGKIRLVSISIRMDAGGGEGTVEVRSDANSTPTTVIVEQGLVRPGIGGIEAVFFAVPPLYYYRILDIQDPCSIEEWHEWDLH
ncbi:hypothetical protein ES708_21620 [subsurface metagenome]